MIPTSCYRGTPAASTASLLSLRSLEIGEELIIHCIMLEYFLYPVPGGRTQLFR